MIRFLYAFIFLWGISVFSQQEEKTDRIFLENQPLKEVIGVLEKQLGYQFSYIDQVIEGKTVSITINNTSDTSQILAQLQQLTGLKFEATGDNFVTISKFQNSDTLKICGHILDENDQPLYDIGVFFKSLRLNLNTDQKGYFESENVPNNSVILLSAPGFRQRVLNTSTFENGVCQNIYLTRMKAQILDEVLIKEYLTTGVTKNKNKINIDLTDVEVLPGLIEPDILQSVQQLPGINSPFETASGIYVRGSTPQQNLVLWNGIKTYHQGHLFGMLSAFNPYVAKNVSFLKSGVNSKYGDRIGAVIDITSDNEIPDFFNGSAGFNMINADAVFSIPLLRDKISLQVSGRRSFTDLLETFTYKQLADRVFQNTKIAETTTLPNEENDFFYMDYNANLVIEPSDDDKIELNSIYNKNVLDFRRSDSTTLLNDDLFTENEGYNLKWNHTYNNTLSHHINGYYTKYLLNYQFITTNSGSLDEIESKKNSVRDIGAEIGLDYKLSEKNKITTGYQFTSNNIRYAFVTTTPSYELILDQENRQLNSHSLYAEYVHNIPKSIHLSLGSRLNRYSELNAWYIEPRIFAQKYFNRHWEINGSAEYRSQTSSQIQESVLSSLSLENQVWTLADENKFPVITSHQYTIGSSYRKKSWLLDAEGYYKKINGITTLTAGFINPIDNVYHKGNSRVFGADVFIKKKIDDYKSWVSYSYINTQNTFEDLNNNESFPGNWNIEHTIKWSHFYKLNDFQFTLGWIWHTGKAFTNIEGVDESGNVVVLEYGNINASNLPIYHRLDFSTTYDFTLGRNQDIKYRLGASILNLYNRKNLLNREFRTTNTLDNRFITSDINSIGFTPNISFRVFW